MNRNEFDLLNLSRESALVICGRRPEGPIRARDICAYIMCVCVQGRLNFVRLTKIHEYYWKSALISNKTKIYNLHHRRYIRNSVYNLHQN